MTLLLDLAWDLTPINEDGSDTARVFMPMLAPLNYNFLGSEHSQVQL